MLSLLLAAQLVASTPAYMTQLERKPTDDPAVVQASFLARQRCQGLEGDLHHYSVSATFPQLTGTAAPAGAINRAIRREVVTLVSTDVPDCPQPVRAARKEDADGEIECQCTVQLHTSKLLSLRCESTSSGSDFGAHPQDHISNLVFDLKDAHRIGTGEMLIKGARPRFRALLKSNLDISGLIDPAKLSAGEIDGAVDAMVDSCLVDAESVTCEVPYWPLTYFMSSIPFDQLSGIVRPAILDAARRK